MHRAHSYGLNFKDHSHGAGPLRADWIKDLHVQVFPHRKSDVIYNKSYTNVHKLCKGAGHLGNYVNHIPNI